MVKQTVKNMGCDEASSTLDAEQKSALVSITCHKLLTCQ